MPHKDPKKKAEYNRLYYQKNKARLREEAIKYYHDHIEEQRKVRRKWAEANREKNRQASILYREKNAEELRIKRRLRAQDPEEILKRRKNKRKYYHSRIKKSKRCKLERTLRLRLWCILNQRDAPKTKSAIDLLGCDVPTLITHIEKQFQPGMSWDNYGTHGWHIDHIIPCAAFDLKDPKEQNRCFHYSNLQPLWALDNYRKGSRIPNNLKTTEHSR